MMIERDELEELLEQFIVAVEGLAFEMPAPNAYTPRLMSMAIHARNQLVRIQVERDAARPAPPEAAMMLDAPTQPQP